MTIPFDEFTSQFFWNFKRMDNVNYNFEIVDILYKAKRSNFNDLHFNKPIIILLIAMVECMLYDLIDRIKMHSFDSFPNITGTIISFFKNTNDTDELKRIILRVKDQNLLRASQVDTIYSDLEHLRNVRNRLHVQNKYFILDRDEFRVFTDTELRRSEVCFERVCEILCNVYPRWGKTPIPMSEFPRPWL